MVNKGDELSVDFAPGLQVLDSSLEHPYICQRFKATKNSESHSLSQLLEEKSLMLQLPESIPGAFQNEILRGVLIQELSGLSCPSGWLSNGLDGCVRVYQNDLSWADASSYCRTQDAQLITSQSSIYNTLLRNERNSTGYWLGFKKSEGPCEIVDVNGNCATVAKFDHPNLTKKSKKLDFLGKI